MNAITDDQLAAVAWLEATTRAGINCQPQFARTILDALPEEFRNPQPALPTDPGVYIDSHNDVVELSEGEWYFNGVRRSLDEVSGYAPLHRLVRERPQVTREQILAHLETYGTSNIVKADAILTLVNGTGA